jgi:two-component system response regulator FlrC
MSEVAGKVLVVDDEMTMREALAFTLNRMGLKVETATDGAEASQMLAPGRYRMMLTDVKMPKMNGIDLLKTARTVCPEMPVLVITGYGTISNAVEAMKHGAADYIVKPFPVETLEKTVEENLLPVGELDTGTSGSDERAIITHDSGMLKLIKIAKNIAASDATILLSGESGTGKELVARYIHRNSPRVDGPFVAFNCAAMPETLMESELFGHEKGSFTGAINTRKGKFELADGGTILLDEISEMDVALQAKLLRVIQEREIDRVGCDRPIPVDVRIIATTNQNLQKQVEKGKFREDLYFRLAVIPLTLPPLRNRLSDIPSLVEHFIALYGNKHGKAVRAASDATLELLKKYQWKGNVRELSNTIERAVLMCEKETVEPNHLFLQKEPASPASAPSVRTGLSLREMERELIFATLAEWDNNRTKAAQALGISIRTLRNKLNEYKNSPPSSSGVNGENPAGSDRQDLGTA